MTDTLIPSPAACEISQLRSNFPALQRTHKGFPVAYFDGPGGTQTPRQVVDAVTDYMYNHNANTHWAYPTSAETDAALIAARVAMADFFNADADEIAFGANMTTLTFHLARGLARNWGPADEVIVTELDHHANVAPWQRLAVEKGVTVHVVRMIPETGQLDWAHLESLVSKKTRLLAIGAASNALGTINDIPRAAALAHGVGALLFTDAVHYAPHELVDVRALDCDFLCCSSYKFYGPHVGVLYGRKDRLEAVDFPKLIPAPDTAPEIAETGTQNHEGIVGAAAAVDFFAALCDGNSRRERLQNAFSYLHERGISLVTRLWDGLAAVPGVTLYGPTPDQPRTPTIAFTVAGVSTEEACRKFADRGLFLSNGNFYAKTVIDRLQRGEDGLIRAGCACYATNEEVDRLVEAVRKLSA